MVLASLALGVPFVVAQFDIPARKRTVTYEDDFGETVAQTGEEYIDPNPTKNQVADLSGYDKGQVYYRHDDPANKWKVTVRKQETVTFKKVFDFRTGKMGYVSDAPIGLDSEVVRNAFTSWLYSFVNTQDRLTENVFPDEHSITFEEADEIEIEKPAPPSTGNKLLNLLPRVIKKE
jgi:hypothetical protein